jgi:hypothetical protein
VEQILKPKHPNPNQERNNKMINSTQKNTGEHVPADLKIWLDHITIWFKKHPEREHQLVYLPARLARALGRSGLVTSAIDGTGIPGKVVDMPAPHGAPMTLFARRPDPVSGRSVPDLLLLGALMGHPPAMPPGMDSARSYEQLGAFMWSSCETANGKGQSLRQGLG